MKNVAIAVLIASLSCFYAQPQTSSPLPLTRSIPLKGVTGKFDHFAFDTEGNRLFIAATGNHSVEILNVGSGQISESIRGLGKPHGVAWIPQSGRLFVADGSQADLKVYEGSPFKLVGTIKLSDDADDMVYDESTHLLYVGHGGSTSASPPRIAVVDTVGLKLVANLPVPAHPEALDIDVAGRRIFANIADSAEVAIIDGTNQKLLPSWKITRAKDNVPMAYDAKDSLLLIGCRTPGKLLVLEAKSGKEVADAPSASGADDLFFDDATRRAFLITGSGEVDIYVVSADLSVHADGTTKTSPGAKTGLLVPSLKTLFLGVPGATGEDSHINVYSTKAP